METDLLRARVEDTAEICLRTSRPKFFGFLSPEQAVFAEHVLNRQSLNFVLFGGYDDAQRVMLGCFPEWAENFSFPVSSLTFKYREADSLTHRDFLGALMALGLKRESVGDILVEKGRAVAFVTDEIADYILNQVEKIGRTGVTVQKGFDEPLPCKSALCELSQTVSSERLDCVVAAVTAVSRATACEKIENGFVSVNSVVCEKTTKQVSEGDIITVRGKGKFFIDSLTDKTRKNRLVLKFKKYV